VGEQQRAEPRRRLPLGSVQPTTTKLLAAQAFDLDPEAAISGRAWGTSAVFDAPPRATRTPLRRGTDHARPGDRCTAATETRLAQRCVAPVCQYEVTGGWGLSEGVMAEGCMFPTRPLSPEM